jgi:[ribosomal protein S18]-alanine N-acetyltransferase
MIEIVRLRTAHIDSLRRLYAALEASGESALFAPHSFAAAHLATLCEPRCKNLHYVMVARDEAIGYGLLRGWDEGYTVPSLGIAIESRWRGTGCGLALMHFLHAAARAASASRVRLRVHPSNGVAISLYERVGYAFESEPDSDGLRVALKELP